MTMATAVKTLLATGITLSAVLLGAGLASAAPIGTTWTTATVPAGVAGLDSIASGNGVFVGVNGAGYVVRSTDGMSWTVVETTSVVWNSVAFGGGSFVLVGDDNGTPYFEYSTDNGASFTASSLNLIGSEYAGLSFGQDSNGDDLFLALDTSTNCYHAVSDDFGVTWVDGDNCDSSGDIWEYSAYGSGVWVSVSDAPSVEFNSDPAGSTWDPVNFTGTIFPIAGDVLSQVSFNGSEFMFLDYDGNGDVYVYTSTDGENWPDGVLASGLTQNAYAGLSWDGAAWIAGAGGTGTGIYRSVDGVNWTQVDANNTQWYSFALGNSILVAGGQPQNSTTTGLNSTIAIGWSTATVAPTPSPTSTSTAQPSQSALAHTGASAVQLTGWGVGAFAMLAFGGILANRTRARRDS